MRIYRRIKAVSRWAAPSLANGLSGPVRLASFWPLAFVVQFPIIYDLAISEAKTWKFAILPR